MHMIQLNTSSCRISFGKDARTRRNCQSVDKPNDLQGCQYDKGHFYCPKKSVPSRSDSLANLYLVYLQ